MLSTNAFPDNKYLGIGIRDLTVPCRSVAARSLRSYRLQENFIKKIAFQDETVESSKSGFQIKTPGFAHQYFSFRYTKTKVLVYLSS